MDKGTRFVVNGSYGDVAEYPKDYQIIGLKGTVTWVGGGFIHSVLDSVPEEFDPEEDFLFYPEEIDIITDEEVAA